MKKGFTLIELPVVRKRAFTLIELLVVIAIIGILATVVILNVASARTKAINAKVVAEMNDANKGMMACLADNATPVTPSTEDGGAVASCNPITSGVGGTWPYLTGGTGSGTYGTWAWGPPDKNTGLDPLTNTIWTVFANDTSDIFKTFTCDQAGCRKNTGAPAW